MGCMKLRIYLWIMTKILDVFMGISAEVVYRAELLEESSPEI